MIHVLPGSSYAWIWHISSIYSLCWIPEGQPSEIKRPLPDVNRYDTVILAFPIWWYTSPMPVWTFLESYPDWKGKTVYLFANSYTDDPHYFTTSIADAKKCARNADIQPGLFNRDIDRLDEWLRENGLHDW